MSETIYSRLYTRLKNIRVLLQSDVSLGTRIYLAAFITVCAVMVALFYGLIGQTQLAAITRDVLDRRLEAMHIASDLKELVISHNNNVLKFAATKQPQHLQESQRIAAVLRAQPASSTPVPRPTTTTGSVSVSAATKAVAGVVFPIPISPAPRSTASIRSPCRIPRRSRSGAKPPRR